jgi:hypothetical protein
MGAFSVVNAGFAGKGGMPAWAGALFLQIGPHPEKCRRVWDFRRCALARYFWERFDETVNYLGF